MKNPIIENKVSQFLKNICDIIGHRWVYHRLDIDGIQIDIRHCKRCDYVQQRKWHMTSNIWMFQNRFTDIGAKKNVEGYGEKD